MEDAITISTKDALGSDQPRTEYLTTGELHVERVLKGSWDPPRMKICYSNPHGWAQLYGDQCVPREGDRRIWILSERFSPLLPFTIESHEAIVDLRFADQIERQIAAPDSWFKKQ
jgi:hypothetical protein